MPSSVVLGLDLNSDWQVLKSVVVLLNELSLSTACERWLNCVLAKLILYTSLIKDDSRFGLNEDWVLSRFPFIYSLVGLITITLWWLTVSISMAWTPNYWLGGPCRLSRVCETYRTPGRMSTESFLEGLFVLYWVSRRVVVADYNLSIFWSLYDDSFWSF